MTPSEEMTGNMNTSLALFTAAALALASCGPGLTREQALDYGQIGYADIVSFIVEGYQCRWKGMDPEELGLSPVYRYGSQYAGFTKVDLDGDGFSELLIGDLFEDGSHALYDILCINRKDASMIHLASGGERDTFTVTTAGTIVETGSNSSEDSFTKEYRLRRGRLTEVRRSSGAGPMALKFENFSDLAGPGQLCGGYTGQREPTAEEMDLFRAVTDSLDKTFTPLSVSTQVVAGINYRFWCRYGSPDGSGHCFVTVYKPLPGRGEARITSIVEE